MRADLQEHTNYGDYARPHPGLLPRGEGDTLAAFWEWRVAEMARAASSNQEMDNGGSLSLGRGQG